MVDGGIGRVICAIPALEAFNKKNDMVVLTGFLEPFINRRDIKVYGLNHQYLWEDIIKKGELIHPEPYWDHQYYNQQTHLIQSFYKQLGLKVPKDIPKPNIQLQDMEIQWANDLLGNLKKKEKKDKVIIYQPHGASATYRKEPTEQVIDQSNRSLEFDTTNLIEEQLKETYTVITMSHLKPLTIHTPQGQQQCNLRQWMALIHGCDGVVGIDSCAQHLAYTFDKPAFIIYGGTYPDNLAYPLKHTVWKKEGFPIEYNPIRLPNNSMIQIYNENALKLDEIEHKDLQDNIRNWVKRIGDTNGLD